MAPNLCTPQTGATLLQRHGSSANQGLSGTNVQLLHKLLSGLLPSRSLVEVSGRPQSGRRALVLHCILQYLLEETDARVVYLHTSPTFTYAQRCRDILHVLIERKRTEGVGWQNQAGQELNTDEIALSVLERLSVVHPFNAEQALQALQAEIDQEAHGSPRVSIACLDTADSLLGGEALSAASAEGESLDWKQPPAVKVHRPPFVLRPCHSHVFHAPSQCPRKGPCSSDDHLPHQFGKLSRSIGAALATRLSFCAVPASERQANVGHDVHVSD